MQPAGEDAQMLVRISHANEVARRYFVTNGFDGALAMLGLTLSFHVAGNVANETVLQACMGAAIALMMSGISSAYVSEAAERRREFVALQDAMVADLDRSAHARAARVVPWIIAAVNGLSPLVISLIIMLPVWLVSAGVDLPVKPLTASIAVAFVIIFLLGTFVGRLEETPWYFGALRTTAIAAVTALVIFVVQT